MKKQKILVSILTFVLACTSMFSASCKKEDNNGGGNGAVVTDTPLFTVSDKQTTIKSSGYNIVENGKSFYEMMDLNLGKCDFALATKKGTDFFDGFNTKRIASKYPNLYFHKYPMRETFCP